MYINYMDYQKELYEPLSNQEITEVLGKFEPITYSELINYSTIEDLLKNDYDWRIILLETNKNKGHWVCIVRKTNNEYYYFNSYGDSYNQDLYLIPKMMRKILGQNNNYLNDLLTDKNVLYNKVKYQGKDTAVCGRYCMFFIDTTCNLKWSFKKFQDFLKEKKKENKLLSWDMLIIKLTNRVKTFTP